MMSEFMWMRNGGSVMVIVIKIRVIVIKIRILVAY